MDLHVQKIYILQIRGPTKFGINQQFQKSARSSEWARPFSSSQLSSQLCRKVSER